MTTPHAPRRIAIACQGGGAHTAFTAGALKAILRHEHQGSYHVAALSGTSGGAICALLAWYGLLKLRTHAWTRAEVVALLDAFWQENAAQSAAEASVNNWVLALRQLQGRGVIPDVKMSPYSFPATTTLDLLRAVLPRPEFVDLQLLLEKHVDLTDVTQPIDDPRLLVGAVDVLSGCFKAFDSIQGEITLDAVRASATLLWLTPAVRINDGVYWDGLFSQNPPIREFVQHIPMTQKPDEIWIIRINRQQRAEEPTTVEQIEDCRNELAGNLSLNQEIAFIEHINQWLREGRLQIEGMKPITVHSIEMSPDVSATVTFVSKLNRSVDFIERLMADGEARATEFLTHWLSSAHPAD